jgi:hypothetical protein
MQNYEKDQEITSIKKGDLVKIYNQKHEFFIIIKDKVLSTSLIKFKEKYAFKVDVVQIKDKKYFTFTDQTGGILKMEDNQVIFFFLRIYSFF